MLNIHEYLEEAEHRERERRLFYSELRELERRLFYLEATRPVDRLPPVGQQLADAWRAEHGDEPFPE